MNATRTQFGIEFKIGSAVVVADPTATGKFAIEVEAVNGTKHIIFGNRDSASRANIIANDLNTDSDDE